MSKVNKTLRNSGRIAALLASTTLVSGAALATKRAAPPLEEQLEEIVVSSAYEGRKLGETILGTTILKKDEILRQLDGSIGETLRRQPGISSTFFGPGASRPIIRGLGGDRIRVLDSGLGSIDASSTSPDHAVAVEPALAERIEILRGTAMLQFGSSAAGGVINVFDGRIPVAAPEDGFEGAFRYGHSTVDNGDEFTGAFNLTLGDLGGTKVVLHADGLYRDTSDYDIPGFAESALLRAMEEEEEEEGHEEEEEAFGTVENSATETKGGSVGLSFLFDGGFLGFNVRKLDSTYGVPGGHGHEEEEGEEHDEQEGHEGEEEELVSIDLDQTRFDLIGEFDTNLGIFKKAKLRFGYADYEHQELEGDEIGTLFSNEGWEGRLDLVENWTGDWRGTTGVQIRHRDFSAVGEEAFVPATTSNQYGFYTVKDYRTGAWHVDLGARFERTTYEVDDTNVERNFNGFSASAGVGYDLSEDAFLGVSVYRTERAPSTEELFSNGPHLATDAFELGDPNLGLETAFGVEATFTYATGPFSMVINGFITNYDDFIFETATGEEEDGLTVFEFRAEDAKLYGFETKAEFHLGTASTSTFGDVDFHLDGQADFVRAKLDDSVASRNLPRIPPFRGLLGFDARSETFDFRTELEYAAEQNRTADFEIPTDDYVLWNAYLTVRPFENKALSFELRGTNLTNSDARQHTSFLKDVAPLPGRNFKVSFRAEF